MLHGIRLQAGYARWYRNRWVRTAALAGPPARKPNGRPDLVAVSTNTNVIRHHARAHLCPGRKRPALPGHR